MYETSSTRNTEISSQPDIVDDFVAWEILGVILVIIVLVMSVATAVVLFVLKRNKRSEKVENKNSSEERFLHDGKVLNK